MPHTDPRLKYFTAFLAGAMVALSGCAALRPPIQPTAPEDPVQARVFEAPYAAVFEAALEAADLLRWTIIEADRAGHFLSADTPTATPESQLRRDVYEDPVDVIFKETDAGVEVEVITGINWRPNVEDAKTFLDMIARQLEER